MFYQEAVDIHRELARTLGTSEARQELLDSLDWVGLTALVDEDWVTATRAYQEELAISRDLARTLHTPDILRTLRRSLVGIGDIAAAHGDWGTATSAFGEALDISRYVESILPGGLSQADRLEALGRVATAPSGPAPLSQTWPRSRRGSCRSFVPVGSPRRPSARLRRRGSGS